ncbi:MAG: autotransporter domain-containing protein [Sphingopyxis sp.]
MNRNKSILLSATALAMFASPEMAHAQSATVVFLPRTASQPSASCIVPAVAETGTFANAISGDGQIVVGFGNRSACANAWRNGVPQLLNDPNSNPTVGGMVQASSTNTDGSIIVGDARGTGFGSGYNQTTIWTATTGFYNPPEVVAGSRQAIGSGYVNANGTYFALNVSDYTRNTISGDFSQYSGRIAAYRWSPVSGYEAIGSLGSRYDMVATGIDAAGSAIAGTAIDPATGTDRIAFVWRAASGLTSLSHLSNNPAGGVSAASTAEAISRDGTTIVGRSLDASGFSQAAFWRNSTITGLGFLPGLSPTQTGLFADNATKAQAVNADGSIIVGTTGSGFQNPTSLAWRWTSASGMQDLNLFATNAGINLGGYVLTDAVGLSDSGQYITGNSFNAAQSQSRGYVLSIAQAPTTLSTTSRLIVTIRLPGVTQTAIVNQTFSTQVDGLLNGANVFTRTVTDPINGAGGVTALADARSALQVGSGLRRVVIGAPVLLSNVTTVLGTTNAVVDVASGTATSTATVNTFGPAVVATGDLGTCATAAANNVNPTGCSLAGTPVTVDAGILNSNVFTNTINSVTPTTTQTVNQLITARWQVSATAGNQFGTVHALSGVAAFDRGDRLVGQLLGMGGASDAAANGITRADMPMRGAHGFGGEGGGLTMFGGYFGNWSRIDADPSVPVANVKGSTNGFVLGLEQALGDGRIGLAMDHGSSNVSVRDPAYPETLAFKHTQIALFAGWNSDGFNLDGAASYGFGTARTSLTTPTTPAIGSRDVQTWSLGAQGGYTVPLGTSASISPHAGIRHVSANLDRFTEVGGPSPLLGRDQTVTRTRLYAGIEAEAGIDLGGATLTSRIHARIARDSGDSSGTADLVFANTPSGPVMQALGPGVGRTVAELGGSIDAAVSDTAHLWIGYDGAFRHGARSHTANAGVSVRW